MIIEKILGYAHLKLPQEKFPEILNAISEKEIHFSNTENGIIIPRSALKKLDLKGLEYEIGGLLPFILRYKKRWGIIVGALLFASAVFISSKIVWCVNVSGNKELGDDYIISKLEEQGFGVGTVIKNIDFDHLHNKVLLNSERIAWIFVNMDGTHANVEVREIREGYDDIVGAKTEFYNLVASEAGQIEQVAAIEGKPQVKIFDAVEPGQLLVSGIISREDLGGIRLESASGSVFAKVSREFEVSVPIKNQTKVKTGKKLSKNSVKIFSFRLNLFRNSGIPYEFYDTIYSESRIYLFNEIPLPLWYSSTVYEEYKIEEENLSEAAAKTQAMRLYREKLRETLGEATLLSKNTEYLFDNESCTVKCKLYCLADIAQKAEIIVKPSEEQLSHGTENSDTAKQ